MLKKLIDDVINWFRNLFWKQEMELTLVGLQNSGKTTLVNVFAVSVLQWSNKIGTNCYLFKIRILVSYYDMNYCLAYIRFQIFGSVSYFSVVWPI